MKKGEEMGDRFYEQQKAAGRDKPKRKLKKDFTTEINEILGVEIVGLDKCTIATLTQLLGAINAKTI
jgi:hypothetical protein